VTGRISDEQPSRGPSRSSFHDGIGAQRAWRAAGLTN